MKSHQATMIEVDMALDRSNTALAKAGKGNPNHDAKGRFSSGSGGVNLSDAGEHLMGSGDLKVPKKPPEKIYGDWDNPKYAGFSYTDQLSDAESKAFRDHAEKTPVKAVKVGVPNAMGSPLVLGFWHLNGDTYLNPNDGGDYLKIKGILTPAQIKRFGRAAWKDF